MKRSFWYICAATGVILLFVELQNGYKEEKHPLRGQSMVGQARNPWKKIRESISFSSNDPFEPLNLKRFQLPDGELTGDEMFIWYAFYDLRDPLGPRIRILANAICKGFPKNEVRIDIGEGAPLDLEWAVVLGLSGCAEASLANCRLLEMEFSTVVFRRSILDEITVMTKGAQVKVKLHRMPPQTKEAVNSCIIAPLFWYNDWPRLFLSFEFWRRAKINKILIHVHSISKEAKKVIDHYVKEGVVEVRPFPWMPFTTQYNPNNHVYYSAEHLTTFFCSVWTDTKYTTMNDIDEIFYVRNRSETLLDVSNRLMDPMTHPDISAIWLEHHALGFPEDVSSKPWDYQEFKRFDFIKQAIPYSQGRMGKYIYQAKYAKKPWIHGMLEYFGNKRDEQVPNDEAIYLHMRRDMNINVSNVERLYPDFKMFDEEALVEMAQILERIFGKETPPFNTLKTIPLVENCISRSLSEIPGQDCMKPTGPICYEALKDQDEWLYAMPTEDSHFVPL